MDPHTSSIILMDPHTSSIILMDPHTSSINLMDPHTSSIILSIRSWGDYFFWDVIPCRLVNNYGCFERLQRNFLIRSCRL